MRLPSLTGRRASRLLVPVSALLLLALLFAGRPGVTADATCNVPPVNLTSALVDDNASVVLNWEASGECVPDEYAVYRRDMDVEGSRMTRIAGVDGDVLTYTDTTVNAGEVYRYRIRSNNIGRRSDVTEITIPEASVNQPRARAGTGDHSANHQARSPRRNRSSTARRQRRRHVPGLDLQRAPERRLHSRDD